MYDDGDDWTWLWGSILMLLMVALIIGIVWFLLRHSAPGRGSADAAGASAVEVLAQRYARGEIGTEEYHERLTNLLALPTTRHEGKTRDRNRPDPPTSPPEAGSAPGGGSA
ncbi:SHOCT domain-containing protein [Embleya sp. NBC_00896]|uniref:SHOCT domain-containing protein n=1 Tax=Embleya sp. NBC_00896 TaxID=2975961 RepID=UPI003862F9BE|nr:SHOCT domain-containing protein [Embleya sp. NBC_00896]